MTPVTKEIRELQAAYKELSEQALIAAEVGLSLEAEIEVLRAELIATQEELKKHKIIYMEMFAKNIKQENKINLLLAKQ